jgi:hypothetical protein
MSSESNRICVMLEIVVHDLWEVFHLTTSCDVEFVGVGYVGGKAQVASRAGASATNANSGGFFSEPL